MGHDPRRSLAGAFLILEGAAKRHSGSDEEVVEVVQETKHIVTLQQALVSLTPRLVSSTTSPGLGIPPRGLSAWLPRLALDLAMRPIGR